MKMTAMMLHGGGVVESPRPRRRPKRSLITALGILSGEVLTCVEHHGTVTLRELKRMVGETTPMVMMAVGALVRQGLVRATDWGGQVVISACSAVA